MKVLMVHLNQIFLARISINRINGSLTFSALVSSDHGIYECSTFQANDTPITSRKIILTVIETLKFVPQPTSKNLELGTLGKVHCKVQGSPTPQVKWSKVIFLHHQKLLAEIGEEIKTFYCDLAMCKFYHSA